MYEVACCHRQPLLEPAPMALTPALLVQASKRPAVPMANRCWLSVWPHAGRCHPPLLPRHPGALMLLLMILGRAVSYSRWQQQRQGLAAAVANAEGA